MSPLQSPLRKLLSANNAEDASRKLRNFWKRCQKQYVVLKVLLQHLQLHKIFWTILCTAIYLLHYMPALMCYSVYCSTAQWTVYLHRQELSAIHGQFCRELRRYSICFCFSTRSLGCTTTLLLLHLYSTSETYTMRGSPCDCFE